MADAVTAGAHPADLDIDDVRWLISCAAASGQDPARVQRVADRLVGALLDLQAFHDGDHDPRRQAALQLARQVLRARDGGMDVPALRERFCRSKSQINKLLRLATSRATSARKWKP